MVTPSDFSGQPQAAGAGHFTFIQFGKTWSSLFKHNTLVDKLHLFLHLNP